MRKLFFAGAFLLSSSAWGQNVTRSGCLLYKDGGFLLQLEDSTEVVQLAGPDLAANLGNRVEIQGAPAVKLATIKPAVRVLDVLSVAPRSMGGCLTAAASLNAQTALPRQTPAAGR